jgi:subtilisin family serine protease
VTSPRVRRLGWTVVVATTAVATTLGTSAVAGAADSTPKPAHKAPVSATKIKASTGKLQGLDRAARGPQTVFVQLSGSGSADVAQKNKVARTDAAKVKSRRSTVTKLGSEVLATARRKDTKATKLFTLTNSIPGVALRLDQAGLKAVAARSDVVKVSRIVPKHATNANTAVLTKVINAWHYAGGLGKGVKVGVIDTGIDYTHKDFGGKGTIAAYDAAKTASASPTWRSSLPALGKAKVAGGADFVGDSYYPDPTLDDGSDNPDYDPVAKPDTNPLDCNDHGTHVSGTAAGYGVTARGNTFTGNYSALTRSSLLEMKVGPGMAPAATLYGLKVFGCEGSTDYVLPALDWALDPNGDGNFSDHLDIINLSLGSDDSPTDDPENAVIDELTSHGVTSVISAGNNGDLTDTGGSPGNATSSIGVASTVDAYQLRDGLKVNAPSTVAGMTDGQMSIAYDWTNNGPTKKPVTGTVAAIPGDNADGCAPLSAADAATVKGKVAWLEWDDDDATRACGSVGRSANVKAAGAIGAIFTSGVAVFGAGITGDDTIPVFQLTKAATDKLRPAATAGTLNVTFDGAYRSTVKSIDESISDTLSGFSSRGVHGSTGVVKPDVAAPGDTIASAGVGTGDGPLVISGTSMAAPLITGVSALVRSRHPDYTPLQVKAAVMNGAGHDVWTGPNQTGDKYAPARVGAGRVDARRSTNATVLAYSPGANNPVSASFGVVPVPVGQGTKTLTRPLTVLNKSSKAKNVKLSYEPVVSQPGVSYSVSPTTLRVKANSSGSAKVTMRVNPTALRHTIDPTMDVDQLDLPRQYVADASGRVLVTAAGEEPARVPVYGAAKPVSTTTASATDSDILLTGKGFSQGSGSTQWTSLTSVLRYGASSGKLPKCGPAQTSRCVSVASQRSGDLQYVGAGATDDYLWFGLSTYADWAKIGTSVQPYVDFDTTGDGKPDFETTLEYFAATDVMIAVTYDLNDPNADPSLEAANFNLGDVDTNAFDNNVLLLPVSKKAVGIRSNGPLVSYTVNTWSTLLAGGDLDQVGPVLFNAGNPRLKVSSELYEDAGNTAIPYTLRGPARALVLHLHGEAGKRAQVLRLPDPSTTRAASPSAAPPTQ